MQLYELCTRFSADLPNSVAYDYLIRERGISPFTLDDLCVGYCGFSTKEHTGVDFMGRIMFPIRNISGEVIAFGGRTMGDGPKYLNSSASPEYNKSKTLYNIDIASDYILRQGQAIVVEGYMDVAALWDSGIRNVVASCGTALTRGQIRLIKRYADEICVLFDPDDAGEHAAEVALEVMKTERIPIYQCKLAFGLDPADYVQFMGKRELIEEIEKAKKEYYSRSN